MRDTIAEQSKELDELRELVHQLQQERDEEVCFPFSPLVLSSPR